MKKHLREAVMVKKMDVKMDSEERVDMNQILRCLTEAVVVTDSRGYVVFLNPSGKKLFKYGGAKDAHVRLSDLCSIYNTDDKQSISLSDMDSFLHEKSPRHLSRTVLVRRDKKKFIVDMNFIPFAVKRDKVSGCIICISNITDSVTAGADRSEHGVMNVLGNFVGALLRQLESQVIAIIRNASAIAERTVTDTTVRDSAVIVSRTAEQLGKLMKQLQSIAKSASFNRKETKLTSPSTVVQNAVHSLESTLLGRIRFKFTGLDSLPYAEIDESVFVECLVSMFFNLSAVMREGILVIGGRRTTINKRKFVVITLKVSAEAIDRKLLSNFYHDLLPVSQKPSSTIRIGFPLIRWIIQQWGGFVRVSNDSAGDIAFSFFLPAGHPIFRISPVRPAHMHFGSILIADDDTESLHEMSVMLRNSGYETIETVNAMRFRMLLKKKINYIALLVIDASMAGYSSRRLIEDVVSAKITLPILLVSGFSRDYIQSELGYETFSFLQKPFDSQQFISAVNQTLLGYSRIKPPKRNKM